VVLCGDIAASSIVGAASICAIANDCSGFGNDRTGTQLPPHGAICVTKLGPASMRLPIFALQFPRRAAPQRRPICIPKATYMAHFFKLILNCTYTMWENERQAGKTTSI
jgi:hypothetical protein